MLGKRRLVRLSAPRPVLLFDDYAWEDGSCQNPGAAPERGEEQSEADHAAALAKHARAVERHEAWKRYLDTFDTSHLEPFIRPGEKPLIFMVRALNPEASAALYNYPELGARYFHLVKYGVVDILNLETCDENGIPGVHKVSHKEAEFGPALDAASLGFIASHHEVLQTVAANVLAASRVPTGVHKSG